MFTPKANRPASKSTIDFLRKLNVNDSTVAIDCLINQAASEEITIHFKEKFNEDRPQVDIISLLSELSSTKEISKVNIFIPRVIREKEKNEKNRIYTKETLSEEKLVFSVEYTENELQIKIDLDFLTSLNYQSKPFIDMFFDYLKVASTKIVLNIINHGAGFERNPDLQLLRALIPYLFLSSNGVEISLQVNDYSETPEVEILDLAELSNTGRIYDAIKKISYDMTAPPSKLDYANQALDQNNLKSVARSFLSKLGTKVNEATSTPNQFISKQLTMELFLATEFSPKNKKEISAEYFQKNMQYLKDFSDSIKTVSEAENYCSYLASLASQMCSCKDIKSMGVKHAFAASILIAFSIILRDHTQHISVKELLEKYLLPQHILSRLDESAKIHAIHSSSVIVGLIIAPQLLADLDLPPTNFLVSLEFLRKNLLKINLTPGPKKDLANWLKENLTSLNKKNVSEKDIPEKSTLKKPYLHSPPSFQEEHPPAYVEKDDEMIEQPVTSNTLISSSSAPAASTGTSSSTTAHIYQESRQEMEENKKDLNVTSSHASLSEILKHLNSLTVPNHEPASENNDSDEEKPLMQSSC